MSMDLMVKALKSRVGNPLRKLVLVKLADNASDLGECWPSYQHIADQCEIARSSVRKHIKALEEQGFLTIEHRDGPKGNSSNMYRLSLCPVVPDSTPVFFGTTPPVVPDSTRTSHSFESVKETHMDDAFEAAWKAYPKRDGSNPKSAAQKCWNARLKEKIDPQVMVEGVARYASYCRQKEMVGTSFVMQAARFFGTNKEFENAWGMPTAIGGASNKEWETPTRAQVMAKGPRSDGKIPHEKWDSGVHQFVFPVTDDLVGYQ